MVTDGWLGCTPTGACPGCTRTSAAPANPDATTPATSPITAANHVVRALMLPLPRGPAGRRDPAFRDQGEDVQSGCRRGRLCYRGRALTVRTPALDIALAISLRPTDAPLASREDLAELDGDDVLNAVRGALATRGSVRVWDTATLGPAAIAAEPRPDLIFNLSEGVTGSGREAQAPALFEWLQWPSLGSD